MVGIRIKRSCMQSAAASFGPKKKSEKVEKFEKSKEYKFVFCKENRSLKFPRKNVISLAKIVLQWLCFKSISVIKFKGKENKKSI